MKVNMHPIQLNMLNLFKSSVDIAFKEIIEKKHLYQNLIIEPNKNIDSQLIIADDKLKEQISKYYINIINGNWYPTSSNNPMIQQLLRNNNKTEIFFDVPDAKAYCKICNRIEPFNLVIAEDFNLLNDNSLNNFRIAGKTVQNFTISYTCQSCKSVPEVFIVRREGFKLTLCGRAPLEFVDVPKTLPKTVREYFSNATIAYQSGQTLAGLFYLRVLLEQWAYSNISSKEILVDEAIEQYMQSLPIDFKERFPSYRELYRELSLDLHRASGSIELFEKASMQIIEHFDAIRLFKLKFTV